MKMDWVCSKAMKQLSSSTKLLQSMAMNVVRSTLGYCIMRGLVFTPMKILLESGFDLLQNRGAMRGNFTWI